ncbi:MAG TPA: hypothetical protein VGB84_04605 [Arachidicoccus sp.]
MAKTKNVAVKLSPEQLQELKDAIIAGEAPKSINERLGVSIANIQYHKGELKKKGFLGAAPAKKAASKNETAPVAVEKKAKAALPVAPVAAAKEKCSFKLIVSGVSVLIEGASAVSVGEDYVKVDY